MAGGTPALRYKLHKNAVYFGGGVGGACDLASDDQIVGAVANRLEGSGHALLIACIRAGRSHSGGHDGRVRTNDAAHGGGFQRGGDDADRKSTRLNSSHRCISYAVFCLKKKE